MEKLNYTLPRFTKHWAALSAEFASSHSDWISVFSETIAFISEVIARFNVRKTLPENCCYLLFSKSLNHSLASYTLLERGLVIDAALSARNGLETLLMLELFAKDKSVSHFELWANGKRYNPSDVRNLLKKNSSVDVGDLNISVGEEYQKTVKVVYSLLSQVTHSNIESLRHTVKTDAPKAFKVWIGGSLEGQEAFINLVFLTLTQTLLNTAAVCCAVFEPAFLEQSKEIIGTLSKRIDRAAKNVLSSLDS